MSQNLLERAQAVRLLILDVDGVLTDGSLFIGDDGQQYKAFNSKDGHGLRMLMDAGIEVGILTGRQSDVVLHRCRDLGIQHIIQGRRDKLDALTGLLEAVGVSAEQCAFMGDDLVDLPVMRRVALGMAVADATLQVREHAHWVSHYPGGRGAVREACEFLLETQGRLEAALAPYLS
ncbi:3-deoxy-D-manno-octulosonate 8-phosphate phosphatase (KDO 8-P phosphatase) [Ectothiorhodosinus mongolicus]|uniref:3-deoxy-D-manno-octulosonate 8-phosphate phosphatase KdsC n=1 Tax=Ectothiorhodosinus mongolicus TaxID=233100 RepID=A0A1R3VS95_9GAMM|nr:HAD-IIIA family hydrolase [Ectothiorhodosinus mongolicus]ULX56710.1 phenylphosphate carboxylase subunit delta [Ectothiorhodosinus mongolicus]SIT66951.1 3-deoxy-D-manno-octulosonate 8-phosphate phosphatase (KDO 8-P phosphatase) [Ectothiorhodosinus mongolicus]